MSTVAQLGVLPDSLLSASPIWNRDISGLKPLDLTLFVRKHQGTANHSKAMREVAALNFAIEQRDSSLDCLLYEPPKQAFTSGDLIEWLGETSLQRRRALLYALEMGQEPRDIISLHWRALRGYTLTNLAAEIVATQPRHIKLPNVFWEMLPNGSAMPLFGLHETALEVSQGMGMPTLRGLYSRMLMLDLA